MSGETTPGARAGTLIVGASQAGLQLAVSLRELGYDEPVTMVGEEDHAPYQRPPLSKSFLGGRADQDSLAFRNPEFYAETRIDLLRGERITKLALAADDVSAQDPREGGTAVTNTGRILPFDRLALAVGARPRRLYIPGAQLGGVHYLRDVDEAEQLRAGLEAAQDVVVIGGGFIGLEAAAVARAQGKSVTVIEAADRLISRTVAPVVSDFYEQAHTRRGVHVLLSVGASEVIGDAGTATGVRLTDGSAVPADVVLVGIGVVPRTMLARQLRLECDGGIVVDRYARTSAPGVVAAGDCTVMPHPLTGQGRVRLESVENAVAQAKVAAATLVGRLDDTRAVPWFWSDQGDLKLQIAGLSNGYDRYVVRGDPDTERFAVLYYREGRLIAADAVNQPADYMAVRKALTQGANIPAELASASDTALKSLIVEDDVRNPARSGPAA